MKSICMCVRPKAMVFPKLYLNDHVISVVADNKYLGVFINHDDMMTVI
jgi:hypothetical protein